MVLHYRKLLILMMLFYGNEVCAMTEEKTDETFLALSRSTTVSVMPPPLQRSRTILTDDEITLRLTDLPGWARNAAGHIYKGFDIGTRGLPPENDATIVKAMNNLNHHALQIIEGNIYTIETWTHHPPGITELDFELAKAMEGIFSAFPSFT